MSYSVCDKLQTYSLDTEFYIVNSINHHCAVASVGFGGPLMAQLKGKSCQKWPIFLNDSSNYHTFLENFFLIYFIKNYHSQVKFEAKSDLLKVDV